MTVRRVWMVVMAAVALALAMLAAPQARAFDTGPHFDITRDALGAEGFGNDAVRIAQVNNWFVDLYENAETIPYSGHASFGVRLLGGSLLGSEVWDERVVKAADRSHFDQTDGGFANAAAIALEWDRLRRTTGALARESRDRNDPRMLLAVLGISLHQVQDFYSHTNWLEPDGVAGRDGPGWAQRAFGKTPTWFDLPPAVREGEELYSAGSRGIPRDHGSWKADGNAALAGSMAKDWPGRPLYTEAHVAAYFASRQWAQAVRAWVADDAFWARALAQGGTGELTNDQHGALNISVASGHWQGQGEACNPSLSTLSCGPRNGPGGNLLDLRGAVSDYFDDFRSYYRSRFEGYVRRLNDPVLTTGPVFEVPSSQPMQHVTRFVQLAITRFAEVDNLDVPGHADMFVRARVAGQSYISGVVNDRDVFSFRPPNAPYRFIKSLPVGATFPTPVRSIRVRIRTADIRNAGTDDDVFLRINDQTRFALDKRLYDDFERGDVDTYSVPIDAAIARGLSIGDIRYLQIEKSRDGLSGGWRLSQVHVWINEQLVVANPRVDRWLSGSMRSWRATSYAATSPAGPAAPVFLQLWEMDAAIRGDNDHTDIHPWDKRQDVVVIYAPDNPTSSARERGASRYKGRRGDGERASLDWELSTITPVPSTLLTPPPAPAPDPALPPVPPVPPDLMFTAHGLGSLAIMNAGAGPAGAFLLSTNDGLGTVTIPGLAAGASIARTWVRNFCEGTHSATADSANQVAETDETNNVSTFFAIC